MRVRRRWAAGLAAVAAAGCWAAAAGAAAGQPTTDGAAAASAIRASAPCGVRPVVGIRHVIVIVMENHSFGEVIGHAPYIDALAGRCGLATAYSAVSHPSLPNYLAITSGRTWGVGSDCAPAQCSFPVNSIFAQVGGLHLAWHAFEESMPAPCDLSSSGVYAVKHDPAAYYTAGGVRAACARDVTRLGNWTSGPLHAALAGSLPAYNFVTPNVCNDMHDCPVSTGDLWLHRWIPAIIASPAYQSGTTVVLITWDEGGSAGNTVPLIVVSPATPRGVRSARPLSHYSLLRTSEYLLGAHRFLGGAARAAGLSRTFNIW